MIIFEDFLFIFLMGGANLAKENMQCQLTSCQVLTGYNINFAIIWEPMAKKEYLSMTFTN